MALSPVQLNTFKDRYALPGEEHPEQMWDRVARAVAEAEPEAQRHSVRDQFRKLLSDFKFVPGGRILLAMGNPAPAVTAMNCYVLPDSEDSRTGILDRLRQWVDIQATGGGVGINLSSLRPNGAPVHSVGGTSSGPVTWAKLFAFTSHDVIIQGGSRRGAAMIMLNDHHPDILEFIRAKETPGMLEGANLSVCISNAFMEAVKSDSLWQLHFNGESDFHTIRARDLWDAICESAHKSGEPGIYFLERANDMANSGYFEKLVATNPCGEQALGPYGACLLGSFNLAAYVREPRNEAAYFDFDAFQYDVSVAVRFNDNIIDLSSYPIEEAREAQLRIRRMGLGVMGLADALIRLGIIYGEPDSVRFTSAIFELMTRTAYNASARLGEERGAFPAYNRAEFERRPFVQQLLNSVPGLAIPHMRNCYLISQAPTGTISLMAGVNSGIEPYFSFDYSRSDRIGDYDVTQAEWAEAYAMRRKGNASMAPWLVTAQDVKPEAHIAIQAACQEWNDSSVSKTINAPNSATVEDVKRAYMLAWDSGLKSIAYYRDGSRDKQVLNHKEATPAPAPTIVTTDSAHVHHRKRLPITRRGLTHKFAVDGIEGYIHTGEYETGAPGEMFVDIAKVGSTIAGLVDWGATMTSLALQYGAPLEELTDKMIGTRFEPAGRTNDKEIPHATSVVDYIGAWMSTIYGSSSQPAQIANTGVPAETITVTERTTVQVPQRNGNLCPTCSTPVVYLDGCESCRNCSWSRCG